MRPVTRNLFVFPACTGILTVAMTAQALAQQPNNVGRPSVSPALSQALSESAGAIQRKDYEAAQVSARQATTLDPQNQTAWFDLAYSTSMLGDLPNAEAAYKKLVTLNPRHVSAFNNLGVLYRKLGRDEEAIASYRKQLEVTPRSRFASYNLGRMLAMQGKWEEAHSLAVLAADLSPQDVTRWQFLGNTQIKSGRLDEARRSFDRALALPHEPMIENNIAYELADAGIDFEKSWQLISGALQAASRGVCEPTALSDGDKCTDRLRQLVFMLDTAGWVLYRQGKTKEAEPYLRASFAITPRGENELHLVAALAKSGDLAEAVGVFSLARARPTFDRLHSQEAYRELVKAAGSETRLDELLRRASVPSLPPRAEGKVIAMVNAEGKVIDARSVYPASAELVDMAKSMALPALSWPGHVLASVRSIDFQQLGDQWIASAIYVGESFPPPPCGPVPSKTVLTTMLREDSNPGAQPASCPGAF